MALNCPYCKAHLGSGAGIVRRGRFWRKSDGRYISRFRCKGCGRGFSRATFHRCYRQNKRHLNERLRKLLCSGVSQRRAARILKISRTTVVRKFLFLSSLALISLHGENLKHPKAMIIEFDDLETHEHTKLKPLSVSLALEHRSRRILGFEVSQMPAKGLLAKKSIKKFGYREDRRKAARIKLFERIQPLIDEFAEIKSDENPHYPEDIKTCFPNCRHSRFKGQRGSITGQGELKKISFDPLFSLNHTCAMYRANINRLFRKTWCTTKKAERLGLHLALYSEFHNSHLI